MAIVALVVSIVAALFTYRLSQRSLKTTTYYGANALVLQMDRMFIDFPMLRPYFYDNAAVPAAEGSGEADLRNRVLAAAEYVVDILEAIWDDRDTYGPDDRRSWARWIQDVFSSSPACRDLYIQTSPDNWYPTLGKLAKELAEEGRDLTASNCSPPVASDVGFRSMIGLRRRPRRFERTGHSAHAERQAEPTREATGGLLLASIHRGGLGRPWFALIAASMGVVGLVGGWWGRGWRSVG